MPRQKKNKYEILRIQNKKSRKSQQKKKLDYYCWNHTNNMKFIEFNDKYENHENLIKPRQNQTNHEIIRNPLQNNENHEN